jgi:hypothetical protein
MSPSRLRILASLCGAGCVLSGLGGCQSFSDPPVSFVVGLRVLGIKAEPPQIAPGASTTLTTLAVDTDGATPAASWNQCNLPPLPGQTVNAACVDGSAAADLQPIGDGLTIPFVMPQVTAASLGGPDATGGVYLPLVAAVDASPQAASPQALTAVYRLRLADADPANANPSIADVLSVDAAGAMSALEETAPTPVQSGGTLSLTVTFAPGSAQSYIAADGTVTTETLTTSWFCTAGALSFEKTSATQPVTVLQLDQRLPATGTQIDLYAVARDERGGTDFAHRTLLLQ